jgi:hypothetical protein
MFQLNRVLMKFFSKNVLILIKTDLGSFFIKTIGRLF